MLEDQISNKYNKIKVKNVKEAARKAYEVTKNGACLLSPAAVSYGMYKNFEERGQMFRNEVLNIKKELEKNE